MASRPGQPVILIELMRFGCALAVLACHYGVGYWRLPGIHPARLLAGIDYASPIEAWLQFGWLGVEIFFLISGLVIMRSVPGVSAATFVRHRVLRLAPAAWICATITLLLVGIADSYDSALWASWGRSIAFWPTGTPVDGSYWTLGVEIAFYAAVTLWLAGGSGTRGVERLVVAIGLASLAFWIGCTFAGEAGAALIGTRWVELLLLKHGCFFALGALIARCQADGVTPLRVLAIAACLGASLMEVAVHAIEAANDTGLPRAIGTAAALFALAVALLAAAQRAQPWLIRRVRPETARAIGLVTYPLYLIHQDAGAALTALLVRQGADPAVALSAAAAAVLLTAIAIARTAEPALRRALDGALSRYRAPHPDSLRIASPPAG